MYEQISAGRKNDSTSAITSFVRSGLPDTALKQMLREYAGPYRELMAFYRCAMMEVETKFKVLSEELSLQNDHNPIESIKTRLKKPESILEKAAARNISLKAENLEEGIHDIAGVRVICSFVSDIYMLANALLKQDDIVLVAEKRKRIVKVEVQLRTIAMDWWASSEHKIRYKKNLPEGVLQEIDRELLECARIGANLDAKMENIQEKALSHCAKTKMNNETAPHSPQHTSS